MEVEFRREMNRNYLVLEPEITGRERHTVRMLTENQIPGLLPFHEKRVNEVCRYYYDITSKQPLTRMIEYRKISGTEIRQIIADMVLILKQLERFLLDESQVCLDPDMIYIEPDSFHCHLCMIPGRKECFAEKFCALSQYLLDHVDHNDGEAVVLAFGIFRESRKENFGMEDIEACLHSTGSRENTPPLKNEVPYEGTETVREERGRFEEREKERGEEEWKEVSLCEVNAQKDGASSGKKEKSWRWLIFIFMAVLPVLVAGLAGFSGILQYKWLLGAAEMLLAAGIFLLSARNKNSLADPERSENTFEEEWEVYTEAEQQRDAAILTSGERDCPDENETEELQTILLTARPVEPETHRLIPVKGGQEIPIGYFPFLIGKSKDITDFCLDLPEISRLHLKIEKTPSGYAVTDLNSTNGTQVNGHLLEANETYPLVPGDEVMIAAGRYRFL